MYYVYSPGGESVTVVFRGMPFMVASDNSNYETLIEALHQDDIEAVEEILFAGERLKKTLAVFGDVEVHQGHVLYDDKPVHGYLVDQILLASRRGVDMAPYGNFLNNVMTNPDPRSREGLFQWLEKAKMPITPDGCFLAWRLVRNDFFDIYTGTMDNSPGNIVRMDRDLCDDDPDRTCSRGLHFCSIGYLPHYGSSNSRIVLVKVNPADVVAFPRDYGLSKGRCCRMEILEEVDRSEVEGFFEDTDMVWGADD